MTQSKRFTVEVTREAVALPWIRPASASAVLGHWLSIALGCGLVVFGAQSTQLFGGLVGILLGIAIIILVGSSLAGQKRRPGHVRIRTHADGIEFVPVIATPILLLLAASGVVFIAVVGLVGAATGIWTGLPRTPGGGPMGRYGGVVALAVAGGWGVADSVSRLLPPRGLRVSSQGVSWRRTLRRVDLRWEEIGEISLIAQRTQLCLVICSAQQQCTTIYPLSTGSDAYVIAQVLEHYRSEPDARRGTISMEAIGEVRPG